MIGSHLAIEPLLASLPAGWPVERFKAVTERQYRRNTDLTQPMMSLKSNGEVVPRNSLGQRQEPDESSLPKYVIANPGDVIVNPMWLVGGAIGVTNVSGAVSPDYRVFELRAHHPRYLHYLLRTAYFVDQYRLYTRAQTTFDRRVQQPDLDNLPVPVPPLGQQRAIAEYLDRETAGIDTLIAKQEQLIATLRERRSAMIRRAVPLPDAKGQPTDKLGRRCKVGNGSTPRRENTTYWEGGSFPWLNSAVVNQRRVTGSDQFVTETALRACHLPIVEPGSVLVGLTGQGKTRGMATLLETEATISQHVAYVTPDPRHWFPNFLLWSLIAAYGDLRRLSDENGSTKGGLTCLDLKRFRLAIPPLDEQRHIAAYLDEQTAKIDTLLAKIAHFIELSKERRAALITTAVTGQIDVRASA